MSAPISTSTNRPRPAPAASALRWSNPRVRAALYQWGLAALLVGAGLWAAGNVAANLARAGVALDFGFFFQRAGFDISIAWIDYDATDSYARAFAVGLLNTLALAFAAVVSATLVGVFAGVAQVSGNPLAEWASRGYVGLMRNLPKLVILLAVYIALLNALPGVRAAFNPLPGVFICNRGIFLPAPQWNAAQWLQLLGVALGAVLAIGHARRARHLREARGHAPAVLPLTLALLAAGIVLPGLAFGWPDWSVPQRAGFSFDGGVLASIQFVALWFALTVYHGAQIAEIVRGGIQAVPRGQWEAAAALGLSPAQQLRRVVLPQVLRITLPPMTSQFLNLLKNTSIGLAVGYTELLAVAGTTINQSFRPVEVMTVVMTVYLAIGLLLSGAMNLLNARLQGPRR
jgi:general L-amino acid transport system permease protein